MGQKVTTQQLKAELRKLADPKRAKSSAWFFKTAKGQYGHGDVFLGVSVPNQRKVAKHFYNLKLEEVEKLIQCEEHEYRLTAVIILVEQFKKGDESTKKQIYDFYLNNTRYINNWDIVDSSAGYIIGDYLLQNNLPVSVLVKLTSSNCIWDRRIAIMSTFAFTMNGDPIPTLKIAEILLCDDHDLIQKAVGWMLREVGKRVAQEVEENFLLENNRYKTMPRTMLRYAIERFPEKRRKQFLHGTA